MIDSHAHLTLFPLDIDAVLERAIKNNFKAIINICLNEESLKKGLKLEKKYPFIHTAAGTHPSDVKREKNFFEIVKQYAKEKKLVAIGECGLDYHYKNIKKELQKKTFKEYLKLAEESSLPLIIHCRDAFSDLFEIHNYKIPTVLHCFTGTIEDAKKALEKNFFISFSGIVTFKNSKDLQDIVKIVPLDHILLETDTPFLAPQLYRGKKCEPSFLIETAKKIAEIKEEKLDKIIEITSENAIKFFSL
ncbi:MAG: hypothetical protein AMS24_02905 [Chlamydiae bacterium SM23_39]|nr:MAG: hypothetical protein AMS24_02905 [Chlamydiae bacterium SM23_39]